MDESLRIVLVGLAAPTVIAALGTLTALFIARPNDAATSTLRDRPISAARSLLGATLVPISVAIAAAVGVVGVRGEADIGLATLDQRLLVALGLLACLGAAISLAHLIAHEIGPWLILLVSASVAATAAVLAAVIVGPGLWDNSAGTLRTLAPRVGALSPMLPLLTLAAAGAWSGVVTWAIAESAHKAPRLATLILLLGVAIAVGAGLTGTGSTRYGQFGFAIAAAALGVGLAVMVLPRRHAPMVAVGVLVAAMGSMLVAGVMFSETPMWVVALLGAAPLLGVLAECVLIRTPRPWPSAIVRIGVAAIIAGIAVAPGMLELAKLAGGSTSDDPYADYPK